LQVSHPLSVAKRHRQSLRRHERNVARRSAARTTVRKVRELIASGEKEEAEKAVREAASVLDRAAQRGILHPNNAARRKSRLMRQVNAIGAAAEKPAPKRRSPRSKKT
jgi:small subunit ribosomal protein S20